MTIVPTELLIRRDRRRYVDECLEEVALAGHAYAIELGRGDAFRHARLRQRRDALTTAIAEYRQAVENMRRPVTKTDIRNRSKAGMARDLLPSASKKPARRMADGRVVLTGPRTGPSGEGKGATRYPYPVDEPGNRGDD